MNLMDFVENASPEQLSALGAVGAWMGESMPKYCKCPSNCAKDCELVRQLGAALERAGQRMQE